MMSIGGCLRDDHLLDRAGAAVDVRRPEPGRQQMPAAEHIERQIAVAVVIAVEEPALLMAMQRVLGGVEVENDLFGGFACASRKRSTNSIAAGSCAILQYFVGVSRESSSRFSVDGAQSLRQAEACPPDRHQRVVTKPIVIVQVLVAERDAEHMLADERARARRALGLSRRGNISRAAETNPDAGPRTQQQAACVQRQRPPSNSAAAGRPWTRPSAPVLRYTPSDRAIPENRANSSRRKTFA